MGVRRGFILGFSFVSISLAALSASIHWDLDAMTLATIMLYQMVIQGTVCPLYWFHLAEIASGAIVSISHSTFYLLNIVMTSSGPYLLKTPHSD